jgi:UDP-glucuronate decarboxylase
MQRRRRLIGVRQLLDEDLDAVCADLMTGFGALSGGRLPVTGGGGFLGYYLVQSVLHWNETRVAGAEIDLAVYDNYARGAPEWHPLVVDGRGVLDPGSFAHYEGIGR